MKNKLQFLKLLSFVVVIFTIQNCYYDEYVPETIDPGTDISFMEDVLPIFESGCNTSGCHSMGDIPPDLTPVNAYSALHDGGYINVTEPENSELYQWMIGNRDLPMPLTGPNAESNAIILAWITEGALDN